MAQRSTHELVTDGAREYQIVGRGKDRFFNIGEVPSTTVRFFVLSFVQGVDLKYIYPSGHLLSAHSGISHPLSQIKGVYHIRSPPSLS